MTVTVPLLAAHGAGRRFGSRRALDPVDLALAPGEAVALVGPNGAGKSTLLALLAGVLEPSEGRVERAAGVRVGWAPQRPAHYGRLSARENLELFARLAADPDPRSSAERALVSLDLPPERRQSNDLSVGMRQRLSIALALLGEPEIVLLDEPTASLDEPRRVRLWELVNEVRGRGGVVCFATQVPEDVARADRVVSIDDGHVAV